MTTAAPTTFTHDQVTKAIKDGFEMAAAESGVDVDNGDFETSRTTFWEYLGGEAGARYTSDQVSTALNRAVDDMAEQLHGKTPDDIDNFAVNAALTLLDNPNASFDDIIAECYDDEDPEVVSGWLADAA